MSTVRQSESPSSLYRMLWRWHFFAGLFVIPFLGLLALTGALYLFHDEIDHVLYRTLREVPVRAAEPLPASLIVQRTAAMMNGQVLQITMPGAPTEAVELIVQVASGQSRTAYADPYDGHLLGSMPYGGVMYIVRKIHSLHYFGPWASALIETAAGWTIVLTITGIYLWFPRGQRGGVVTVRATAKERLFWRDVHAVTGVFAAGLIPFLAITGMPWSDVWGDTVQRWATQQGLGKPKAPARVLQEWALAKGHVHLGLSGHEPHDEAKPDLPWALQKAPAPASAPPATARAPISLDQALAILARFGMPKPFSVGLPIGRDGAFLASYRPDHVEQTRLVYLDQYTGAVIGDVGFANYGPVAKAVEWGVATHMGKEYGPLNRALMLAGCIAILILVISAPVMWWKRRPKGTFGVPRAPDDPRVARGVAGLMIAAGIIFPLVGLSLVAAFLVERALAFALRKTAEA